MLSLMFTLLFKFWNFDDASTSDIIYLFVYLIETEHINEYQYKDTRHKHAGVNKNASLQL